MRTEQQLQDLLREAAEGRSPEPGAWSRFQDRRRRAFLRRSLAAVLAAALSAGAVFAVSRLVKDRPIPVIVPGNGQTVHHDRLLRYQLAYPNGWVREGIVGSGVSFAPSKDALTGEGMATAPVLFVVSIGTDGSFDAQTSAARSETSDAQRTGATVNERSTKIDGKRAVEFTIEFPTTAKPTDCENSGCRKRIVVIDWTDQHALGVSVLAANQNFWDQYGDEAQAMIGSIRSYAPPKDQYIPVHGAFSVEIPEDELTDEILRFMDARAERAGAEPWLSSRASGEYASNGSGPYPEGLRLYPADGYEWTYTIANRTDRSDGQALFEVSVRERVTPEPSVQAVPVLPNVVERMIVGPRTGSSGGDKAFVVLSVLRAPACEAPPGAACL